MTLRVDLKFIVVIKLIVRWSITVTIAASLASCWGHYSECPKGQVQCHTSAPPVHGPIKKKPEHRKKREHRCPCGRFRH
jgi:hypothetical protein